MNDAADTDHRILVVDDDESVLEAVVASLGTHGYPTACAGTLAHANRLWAQFQPTIIVLDVSLPDGDSVDWLMQHEDRHRAAIVAMSGRASAWQGHQLSQLGTRAFLEKPFDEQTLLTAIEHAKQPPDLHKTVAACVGHLSLRDAEFALRRSMIEEALDRSNQSRRGAARILSVSREMLQHAIRKLTS